MLDIDILRDDPDRVRQAIIDKNGDPAVLDVFLALDKGWRAATTEVENLRAEQKKLSAARDINGAKKLKEEIKQLEEKVAAAETERLAVWKQIPNLPSADTPVGKDENSNQVVKTWGEPPKLDFEPKDHVTLGEGLDMIDIETAGQVSGTRFGYLKGDAVLLQFALIQHAFKVLADQNILKNIAEKVERGYSNKPFRPVLPPVMIRPEVFDRMARLEPKEERYYIPSDDLFLIGSAEHTLGPMHMDQIIPESELPLRYVGYSTSFRREAGASGKDTRGILRVHQFDKVEMESFTVPERSQTEQDFFVAVQEYLMQSLELPYRLVLCSTGDQGGPDARHVDLETWMPAQDKYRETHSADLMTDYQSRRLQTRVRRADGKIEYAHMNDATVFAAGRTLIAIMENYQTKEGNILVPKALQTYVGKEIISRADVG
jgi:seryl-tRNA synthetase